MQYEGAGNGSITSRDNPHVKYACRLAASAAFRAQEGLFFAEGARLCTDLAGRLHARAVFYTAAAANRRPELPGLAPQAFEVSEPVAEKLAGTKSPQGVCALFEMPEAGLGDMPQGQPVLICEGIQDPANLGAMVRSAAGLGFGAVALTPKCASPYGPKALRASMGAVARLPLVVVPGVEEAAEHLHGQGYILYAAALQNAVSLAETAIKRPCALLVGSEGAGLSPQALAAADAGVYIPMQNGVESLNAAVAAAILMHAIRAIHNA